MRHLTRMKHAAAVLAVAVAAAAPGPAALAAGDVLTIGACQPITGRFAFAGVNINAGLQDYIAYANEKGLVKGKKLVYVYEDSGYETDKAVACFKKMMAQHNPVAMFGESTGLGKAIAPELNARYKVLYGSNSFSAELANPKTHPYSFVSGPTYSDMFGILLEYIARQKGAAKAKVAFFYSDTEFGKDPIADARKRAAELGIEVVAEVVTKVGALDVTSEVLNLKKANPDYVIFHGYVLAPIPEVIRSARDLGLKTRFMGTYWSMDKTIIDKLGQDAEGYMGVMPYAYWWDDAPGVKAMREYNARVHPGEKSRANSYFQGWFTGMVYVEAINRVLAAKKPVTGDNLKDALARIKDWDVGGLTGKVTFVNNKTGVGRVYQANVAKGIFEPVSDWIYVK
jgi:branched-chain amino acid transport system substrate-binding protein